jgi:L,D-transpeptidase catalytic domain
MLILRTASTLVAITLISSCSLFKSPGTVKKAGQTTAQLGPVKAEIPLFDWRGEGVNGPASVRINLSEQKAHIFKGGQDVGWTYVATGTPNRPTPTGSFHIMEKKVDKCSNRWGIIVDGNGNTTNWNACNGVSSVPSGGHFVGAPMPNWMRLTGSGVGMHGGPIPNPGSPASHGCIRLPYEMASNLFGALPEGTPVTITD